MSKCSHGQADSDSDSNAANIIVNSYLPIVLQNILHGSDAILYPANESKKIKN